LGHFYLVGFYQKIKEYMERKLLRRGDIFRSEYFGIVLEFIEVSGHWTGEELITLYNPSLRCYYELIPEEAEKLMQMDNVEFVG
jgi:hypothetical protein